MHRAGQAAAAGRAGHGTVGRAVRGLGPAAAAPPRSPGPALGLRATPGRPQASLRNGGEDAHRGPGSPPTHRARRRAGIRGGSDRRCRAGAPRIGRASRPWRCPAAAGRRPHGRRRRRGRAGGGDRGPHRVGRRAWRHVSQSRPERLRALPAGAPGRQPSGAGAAPGGGAAHGRRERAGRRIGGLVTAPSVATFRALGTTATIAVTDASALPLACQVLTAEVSAIDRACSRFRDDSELHRVELAAPLWTPISPRLLEALRVALRAARLTNGLVTPTVGGPMRAAGYDRDLAALRPTAEPARHEPAPDWRAIELDVENRRVRLPRGVHVD